MDGRRRAEELFEAALDLAPADRATFLDRAVGGDSTLRNRVLALLSAHDRAEGILDVDARALIAQEPGAPERLGAYRVVRELGRGGMGVVYEAERDDGQFHRRVAIKILRAGGDPGLRQRVLAERQILAALDHPGIARLLDGGVSADGAPFLVMEHVDGLPIDVYCDRMRLSVRERLRLFVDVARTVDYAHRNLVVHRDLKPSNILVTPDGRPKLLDFGVAKLLNPGLGSVASHTLHDRLALTPEYASPEQLRGEALTTLSDVYALGGLLYELLTARRPFAASNLAELVKAVCEDDVRRPSAAVLHDAVQPSVDGGTRTIDAALSARSRQSTPQRLSRELRGDLEAIVLQALRREPRKRYTSAELLARDVEQFLDGLPVTAHARGRLYAFGKFVRRHSVTATAVVLAVLSLLAGTAISLWQASEARAQRDRAELALTESDQVTEFLIELFESSAPGAVVTNAVTARDLVRRGAARIDGLTGQPRVQVRMLAALGRVHEGLGEYEEGQRLTQRALAIQTGVASTAPDDVAALLLQLGILQRRRAQYDSAEASFTRARDMLRDAPRASPMLKGRVLNQMASIAIYRGQLAEAERRARVALDVLIRDLGETHRLSVNALTYLGAVQWRRGNAEAEQHFRRAIALRPEATGSLRSEVMTDRLQLAELLIAQQRGLDEAERTFRDVLATMRVHEPDEFGHAIWARGSLAALLESRGELDEAERLRTDILELQRTAYGAEHPFIGFSLAGLAGDRVRAGRLDEAERLLDDAATILSRAVGTRHPWYGAVLSERAGLFAARGEHRGADSLMAAAMQFQHIPGSVPWIDQLLFRAEMHIALGDYTTAASMLDEAAERATSQVAADSRRMRDIEEMRTKLERTRSARAATGH